ncbi:MAG TPA: hypothetical protein VFV58_18685 [Blastocatellia bacterium]|jgi:hypothetical protein|nr:hypothetical protein [Blastocatellia bacterium]
MEEKHFVLDGDSSLQQQEDSLNTAQSLLHAEVKIYAKGERVAPANGAATTVPQHPNFVTIERIDDFVNVKDIFLVILGDVAAEDIRQAGQQPSRSRIFFSDVFVGGVVKKVAGYR